MLDNTDSLLGAVNVVTQLVARSHVCTREEGVFSEQVMWTMPMGVWKVIPSKKSSSLMPQWCLVNSNRGVCKKPAHRKSWGGVRPLRLTVLALHVYGVREGKIWTRNYRSIV